MKLIPEEIVSQYVLNDIEHNGYIYAEISKVMYGLPQDRRIANYYIKNLELH